MSSQSQQDQIANIPEELVKLGDAWGGIGTGSEVFYFYKLQRIYKRSKDENQTKLIEIGNNTKSIFCVDESEDNFEMVRGFVGQWEQSMEIEEKTNSTKIFNNQKKRRLLCISTMEFLQSGTWIVSIGKPLDAKSDLTKTWIAMGVQSEMGWAQDEQPMNYLDLDEIKPLELDEHDPIREMAKEVILIDHTSFKNVNGTSLVITFGSPLLLEDEEDTIDPTTGEEVLGRKWNLDRIRVKGNWQNSLFHSIELRGMNKLVGDITNIQVQANKSPIPINPLTLKSTSNFYSLWLTEKVMEFGKLSKLLKGQTSLNNLLWLETSPEKSSYVGKGRILTADFEFVKKYEKVNAFRLDTNVWPIPNLMGKRLWVNNNSNGKSKGFTLSPYNDIIPTNNLKLGEFNTWWGALANNNSVSFYWNGYEPDQRKSLNNNDTRTTNFTYLFKPRQGVVTFVDDKGKIRTVNRAIVKNAKFSTYTGSLKRKNFEIFEDGLLFVQNAGSIYLRDNIVDVNRVFSMSFKKDTGLTPELVEDRWPNDNNAGLFIRVDKQVDNVEQIYLNLKEDEHDIEVFVAEDTDGDRLKKLLDNMILYTWYYKNGFPSAKFDTGGNPLNMGGMVKNKFTNSNYTPQQVITNLVEQYKQDYPEDIKTEQFKNFLNIVMMLGDNILSDYNINGGLNDHHKVLLPWYLDIKLIVGKVATWFDGDIIQPDGTPNLKIDNTQRLVREIVSATNEEDKDFVTVDGGRYSLKDISARVIPELPYELKSSFFDLEHYKETGVLKVLNNDVHKQPTITTTQVNRTYESFDDDMSESDISTIPADMTLSGDYMKYMFNMLLPNVRDVTKIEEETRNETRELVDYDWSTLVTTSNIGKGINQSFTKREIQNFIPNEFQDIEYVDLDIEENVGAFPEQFELKGLFGNNLKFEFMFAKYLEDDILNRNLKKDMLRTLNSMLVVFEECFKTKDYNVINSSYKNVENDYEEFLTLMQQVNLDLNPNYDVDKYTNELKNMIEPIKKYNENPITEEPTTTAWVLIKGVYLLIVGAVKSQINYVENNLVNEIKGTSFEIETDIFNDFDDRVCLTQIIL